MDANSFDIEDTVLNHKHGCSSSHSHKHVGPRGPTGTPGTQGIPGPAFNSYLMVTATSDYGNVQPNTNPQITFIGGSVLNSGITWDAPNNRAIVPVAGTYFFIFTIESLFLENTISINTSPNISFLVDTLIPSQVRDNINSSSIVPVASNLFVLPAYTCQGILNLIIGEPVSMSLFSSDSFNARTTAPATRRFTIYRIN